MPDKPADPVPIDLDADQHKNRQRLLWGIVCIVGPGLLFAITMLIYALVNLASTSTAPAASTGSDLFAAPSNGAAVANVMLFMIGTLSAIAFVPGIIVGIILLSKRRKPRGAQ